MLLCLSPCPRHFSVLLCSSYSRISLMHSMLSLAVCLPLSFPSPLFFLSPCPPFLFLFDFLTSIYSPVVFPGGENLIELLETTGSDLFIMVFTFSMCVFMVVLQ